MSQITTVVCKTILLCFNFDIVFRSISTIVVFVSLLFQNDQHIDL